MNSIQRQQQTSRPWQPLYKQQTAPAAIITAAVPTMATAAVAVPAANGRESPTVAAAIAAGMATNSGHLH